MKLVDHVSEAEMLISTEHISRFNALSFSTALENPIIHKKKPARANLCIAVTWFPLANSVGDYTSLALHEVKASTVPTGVFCELGDQLHNRATPASVRRLGSVSRPS